MIEKPIFREIPDYYFFFAIGDNNDSILLICIWEKNCYN